MVRWGREQLGGGSLSVEGPYGPLTDIVEAVLAVVCFLSCVWLGLPQKYVRACTQNHFDVNITTVYCYGVVVST